MIPAYIVKDESGLAGQSVALTQGESKTISTFLFNPDGSPLFITGTITEVLVKVFSNISQLSIQKKFSLSQVTIVKDSVLGSFGFIFSLTATDTGSMAANNSGLPLRMTLTLLDGTTRELDFQSVFNVSVPVVQT